MPVRRVRPLLAPASRGEERTQCRRHDPHRGMRSIEAGAWRGRRKRHRGRFRRPPPVRACPAPARRPMTLPPAHHWRPAGRSGSVAARHEAPRSGADEAHGTRRHRPARGPGPVDWVTRAADDAIRHARQATRRPAPTRADRHLRLGRQPVRPGPPGQPARVPHRALRGRGAQAPRHPRPPPAQLGRLRPVPQGAGRRRPRLERAHRPTALRRTRPLGLPRLLGRALQGPAARGARRDGRGDGGGLPDRGLPRRRVRRAGADRGAPPRRHRARCWRPTAPRRPPRSPRASRRPTRWPALADSVADEDDAASGAAATSPGSPTSPTAASAGATPPRSRRTATRPPTSPTPAPRAASRASPNLATQHEGKLVWKVDWPMRWSVEGVDFEPGGVDHATPGSSYTVGKELVKDVYGGRAPSFVGYSFVGVAGGQVKMSSSRGRRADRGRRAADPRGAGAALALRAPAAQAGLQRRLRRPRWCASTTSGTPWAARRRTRRSATRRCSPSSGPSATTTAGTLPTPQVVVPFRVLSSVADVTAGSADLISRTVGHVGYAHDDVTTWSRGWAGR